MEATGETAGYRPVSGLAVAAAVGGAVSAFALSTPILWILPLVGVVLAVAGLADTARPGAEKAGRAAALVGLALSVGFGVQSVTSFAAARWIVDSRVKAVVGTFLDAVRDGRLADAQSVLAPVALPVAAQPDGFPGAAPHDHDHDHDKDHGPEREAAFKSLPAVAAILGCGTATGREVLSTGRDEENGERWCAEVRLWPCAERGEVRLKLELAAAPEREGQAQIERWKIVKLEVR